MILSVSPYKRKSVIQDEETGKKQSTFTTVSDRFNASPLPKVWIDNLKGGFQKDEETALLRHNW